MSFNKSESFRTRWKFKKDSAGCGNIKNTFHIVYMAANCI